MHQPERELGTIVCRREYAEVVSADPIIGVSVAVLLAAKDYISYSYKTGLFTFCGTHHYRPIDFDQRGHIVMEAV